MSHKYECSAIFLCRIQTVKACCLNSLSGKDLCYSLLVIVNDGCVISDFTEKRLGNLNRLKLVALVVNSFHEFVILCTMH